MLPRKPIFWGYVNTAGQGIYRGGGEKGACFGKCFDYFNFFIDFYNFIFM
jgi:hypothetical protein